MKFGDEGKGLAEQQYRRVVETGIPASYVDGKSGEVSKCEEFMEMRRCDGERSKIKPILFVFEDLWPCIHNLEVVKPVGVAMLRYCGDKLDPGVGCHIFGYS